MKARLRAFAIRYEMAWHAFNLLCFAGALVAVVLVFPDVSNLWVSIFILVGSFATAVTAMIAALKASAE